MWITTFGLLDVLPFYVHVMLYFLMLSYMYSISFYACMYMDKYKSFIHIFRHNSRASRGHIIYTTHFKLVVAF